MNAALLHQSKYLKAVEFEGKDRTFTIKGVKIEELEREDNTKERKGIVTFADEAKAWVLNVTNIKSLVAMFGNETDDWIGKRVTVYPEANSQSDSGFAIRVRGSPDIDRPVTFTLKLARKKPKDVVLKKTGQGNGAANGNPAQQQRGPSKWQRILALADKHQFPRGDKDADLIALVKKSTNDKPGKDLAEEDFGLIEKAMLAQLGIEEEPPPDAPPSAATPEDDIPF